MIHKKTQLKLIGSIGLLFGFIIVSSGCASIQTARKGYDAPLLNIVIEPQNPANNMEGTLGIFNFSFAEEGPKNYSGAFSEYLQICLLKGRFVRTVERIGSGYHHIDAAVGYGREKGYDLICVGRIDSFYWGGLNTNSKAAMTVKVIDTKSGATLWFIKGQMEGEYLPMADYFFYRKDSRPAPSPVILCQSILDEISNTLVNKANLVGLRNPHQD